MKANKKALKLEAVFAASNRISAFIARTPLLRPRPSEQIYYKMECWQTTGSFKIRGALNAILPGADSPNTPIVAASAGNHGLGVAYAAKMKGQKAILFVPQSVSAAKFDGLKSLDAQIIVGGQDYDEAEEKAIEFARRKSYPFIHAFADHQVIAGQGTVGLEIARQLPAVRQVLVPVGGGGLISGVALALKRMVPGIQIVGLQSEASPAMHAALQAGRVVETPILPSLADGLAGRFVHELTLTMTQKYVDEVLLVSEAAIKEAMKILLTRFKFVVEGSAAVGLAAILEGKCQVTDPCVLILTGGNVSMTLKDIL